MNFRKHINWNWFGSNSFQSNIDDQYRQNPFVFFRHRRIMEFTFTATWVVLSATPHFAPVWWYFIRIPVLSLSSLHLPSCQKQAAIIRNETCGQTHQMLGVIAELLIGGPLAARNHRSTITLRRGIITLPLYLEDNFYKCTTISLLNPHII